MKTIALPSAPLFVPGNKPALFAKAAQSGADAVILDLEDAVAPDAKALARESVCNHGLSGIPVIVRINASGTPWHLDDLAALARADIAGVMVPKADMPESLVALFKPLGRILPIIPLIESARGLHGLTHLLQVPNVIGVAFGSLDYALDIDCTPDWEPLLAARSELVFRSRLAGLPGPMDGVTTDLTDMNVTYREAIRARSLGFRGKLAIHPKQVASIIAAMKPTADDIIWAEKILSIPEGEAVGSVDGAMVDAPVTARARRILASR
jgi:citrate lyase subunit beta/citryl-CoA lyase